MSDRAILQLLNNGECHDANQLAGNLKISSSELHAKIDKLLNLGLEIEYVPGSGYRLGRGIKLLEKSIIFSKLPKNITDSFKAFDIKLTMDSTNCEAMRFVRKGNTGKAIFVAEKQENGRGRRGRSWFSPMARNIYMTLVWPFTGSSEELQGVSLVTALSVVKALQISTVSKTAKLNVKWPNDVWLNEKKLAGILLELYRGGEGSYQVIIGIGINVNMSPDGFDSVDQAATDLVSHTKKEIDRNEIIARLMQQLDCDLEQFATHGFSSFQRQWQLFDLYHEKEVEVRAGNHSTFGKVKGVSNSGALMLETSSGLKQITGGELAPSVRAVR